MATELEVVDQYLDQWIKQVQQDVQVERHELVHQIGLFEQQARQYGLNHKQLNKLVHTLLTVTHFDEYLGKQLARALLPRGTVPKRAVIDIIGALGRNKNYVLLTRLFRWLVDVFPLMEDPTIISQLYGVLFHYLDYESLRPSLCQLLSLVTRREHVQMHRIRRLYVLHQRLGNEPPLLGLFAAFHGYVPDMSLPSHSNNNHQNTINYFKPADPQWMSWLSRVQQQHSSSSLSNTTPLPLYVTGLLTRRELPAQLTTLLSHRTSIHALVCLADTSALTRLHHVLEQQLMEAHLRSSAAVHPETRRQQFHALLVQAVRVAQVTQETMPVFESFLTIYLKTWNGHDEAALIFQLLRTLHPRAYNELYALFLRPLFRLFSCASATWRATLLHTYGALLKQWVSIDWSIHYRVSPVAKATVYNTQRVFRSLDQMDYFALLRQCHEHVLMLSALALHLDRDHVAVQHAVLALCEQTSRYESLPFVMLPPVGVVYRMFYSDHVMAVSRMAGILTDYKRRFDVLKQQQESDEDALVYGTYVHRGFQRGLHRLKFYRGYVTDMSNGLWKNQGWTLKAVDDSAACFQRSVLKENPGLIRRVVEWFREVNYAFSLTHSSALASLALQYLVTRSEYQRHPVKQWTPSLLTSVKYKEQFGVDIKEFRVAFLNDLKEKHVVGLHRLLYTFMQSLSELQKQATAMVIE